MLASPLPTDKPDAPVGQPVASNIKTNSLTLAWSGPSYDGGSQVTDYRVEMCVNGQSNWKTLTSNCKVHTHTFVAFRLIVHPTLCCMGQFFIYFFHMYLIQLDVKPTIRTSIFADKFVLQTIYAYMWVGSTISGIDTRVVPDCIFVDQCLEVKKLNIGVNHYVPAHTSM